MYCGHVLFIMGAHRVCTQWYHFWPSAHPPIITPMSQSPRTLPAASGSSFNFRSVFDTALNQYKKKTKNDLVAHQLTARLESCSSPSAILAVLNEQYGVQEFIQSQRDDERPKQLLNATANVLCAFSAAIGQGVGLVNTRISSVQLYPNTQSHRCSRPRT
jgi:hypothetical protein